jgi:hypothetical protein
MDEAMVKPRPPPANGWTLNTLHDYMLELFKAANALECQRLECQDVARRALDEQYRQRFADSEKAVTAAFAAAKEAVNAALAASKEAVNAALTAAKEAVAKAETATNERFASVNEFRKSLSDLSGTMLTRIEAEQRFRGLTDKVETIDSALGDRLGRIEQSNSERTGAAAQGETLRGHSASTIGLIVAVVAAVIAAAAVVVDLFVRRG